MYKNILVAVALDQAHNSAAAFEVARALAAEGASITALHVLEEIPAYVAHYVPVEHAGSRRSEAEAGLKAELGGVADVKPVVMTGHAGPTIVSYAKEHGVDCIVIASHRPGLQDYFLGSTAGRVVRHAPCAVHVTR
ncbi:universal stress protein [uncultured Hoeflea sp.]|uniref:universal stress protein n=1 Tax=uncultured Hoeflea sp. TaxID=538666 RepID=UPI002629E75B|nr:universal stress protein [uncultured Hoeflea sp.]